MVNPNESCNYSEDESKFSMDPEAIVISGMAGKFPGSDNIDEFEHKIYNKLNCLSPSVNRGFIHLDVPPNMGFLKEYRHFDAGYFGIDSDLHLVLDYQTRIELETAIEAIIDAGMHPSEFENTNTGVFIGLCHSEVEAYLVRYPLPHAARVNVTTGTGKYNVPQFISYHLKTKGPSMLVDTACSSSLYALEHAYEAIKSGQCDRAIVGGSSLCHRVGPTVQFFRLGVLSPTGVCSPFDESANGYVRSEAICAVILQKAKEAKRIYAEVVHAKTNCDGYKEEGITYPSGNAQLELLNEFYNDCKVSPNSVSYVEAHGTGTKVGDPEECKTLDEVFGKNRSTPVLIGSVKSNIGHTEAASGLLSVVKSILALESGIIGPNINFNTPKSNIIGILEGRLKVVTEKTKFKDDRELIAVNSFGFGGGNCHVLLKGFKKSLKKDSFDDNLPRLVCVSGRNSAAVEVLLNDVAEKYYNPEYVAFLHQIFRFGFGNHPYRGYIIMSKKGEIIRSCNYVIQRTRPILCIFFGKLDDWYTVLKNLQTFSSIQDSLNRINEILLECSITPEQTIFNNSVDVRKRYHILGDMITQICIADLLKNVITSKLTTNGSYYGEFISAYMDGVLKLEETVTCAVILNKELQMSDSGHTRLTNGGVNVIGINHKQSKQTSSTRETLIQKMQTVIKKPRIWIGKKESEHIASLEYFIDAIINPVVKQVENTVDYVLEVGNNNLELYSEDIQHWKFHTNFEDFFKQLGCLYEIGYDVALASLYPKVEFPISKGSARLSSKLLWNHSKVVEIPLEKPFDDMGTKRFKIDINESDWSFIEGHNIDGRILFPAAGYLYLVWKVFAPNHQEISTKSIGFENCHFIRATPLSKNKTVTFIVMISASRYFEIMEGGTLVVNGRLLDTSTNPLRSVKSRSFAASKQIITTKDIYKEFRLRGYYYTGLFQAINKIDITGSTGEISWAENFVTFLDNLFQMKIIMTDTRMLYVPTSIAKLIIQPVKHYKILKNSSNSTFLAYYNEEADIISSGGIEIQGLLAKSIQRKRNVQTPVLERYEFIPNITTNLSINQSLKVNAQIVIENLRQKKIFITELIDSASKTEYQPLSPVLIDAFEDEPTIQAEVQILSDRPLQIKDIPVENTTLEKYSKECTLIIASNLLQRNKVLDTAFNVVKEKGYIISRENSSYDPQNVTRLDLNILTVHYLSTESIVLLSKKDQRKKSMFINIKEDSKFRWLPLVQSSVKSHEKTVLYAENDPQSGIVGLTKCLMREPGINIVSCVLILDKAQPFEASDNFYTNQLSKNMAINVYKNGTWGTYRHLLLDNPEEISSNHCYVNQMVNNDMSSFRWFEGPLKSTKVLKEDFGSCFVQVNYAALNFKDVMLASGKISGDVTTRDRTKQDCLLGLEFSGTDNKGKRVAGTVSYGALATVVQSDISMLIEVPDEWSLEEAVTIPAVYSTVIYAMVTRGKLQKGESVLIHSGVGGIGQAAIRFALHLGCTVFATVGNTERKEYLKTIFPELPGENIGNSHDLTFEQLILKKTGGKGVDAILNSLAEEKLIASVRCLAKGGRFLEIGKFDITMNNSLKLDLLKKDCSFHGVMLDFFFSAPWPEKRFLMDLLCKFIRNGAIKPLQRTVFKANEIQQGFRFMASGKHMGKVVFEILKEKPNTETNNIPQITGLPRYYCNPNKSYILVGGLGGFGLELADWLILRGAKILVLVSRSGIKNGYQKLRLSLWKKYGTIVKVSTDDVSQKSGCVTVITEAQKLGPVAAIFNLAAVLQDAIFENQTPDMFKISLAPKAITTKHFDEVSRKMCPQLEDFVVFSSVSCGRGNPGQTNYGMGNSVMERICEERKKDGYPALAIEWGAIGEVGLVADMQENNLELEICGTIQQRISNCLQLMDVFLRQKTATTVSSMVVAEKKSLSSDANILEVIASLIGVTDLTSVSYNTTMAEMGMDSMTAIEIKQVLERNFEIFLTPKELRGLTFAKLQEYDKRSTENVQNFDGPFNESDFKMDILFGANIHVLAENLDFPLVKRLESKVSESQKAKTMFLIPGIEGAGYTLEHLCKNLYAHTYVCQVNYTDVPKTFFDQAQSYVPILEKYVSKEEPFIIIGYSIGSFVAFELASLLEASGFLGTVVCIDGSPIMFHEAIHKIPFDYIENNILSTLMTAFGCQTFIPKYLAKCETCTTFQEKLDELFNLTSSKTLPVEKIVVICKTLRTRLAAVKHHTPAYNKITSKVLLYKPTKSSWPSESEDYRLSSLCKQKVAISVYEGDHRTILQNEDMINNINAL